MAESSLSLYPQSFSYKIKEKLGEGLNACVYKALREHSLYGPSQVVALKILQSKACVKKWKREFQILSSLSSPYCVSVLGWEVLNSRPTLVLEWVEGVRIEDLFMKEKLQNREVLNLCWQIHEGLKDLRAAQSYHGDLNPSNVLIDKWGQIKLIDFGLACPEDEKEFHSMVQVTKKFAAPEVLQGKKPDYFSDLYSLGALMKFLYFIPSCKNKDTLSFLKPCFHLEAKKRRIHFVLKNKECVKKNLAFKVQRILRKKNTGSLQTRTLSNKKEFFEKKSSYFLKKRWRFFLLDSFSYLGIFFNLFQWKKVFDFFFWKRKQRVKPLLSLGVLLFFLIFSGGSSHLSGFFPSLKVSFSHNTQVIISTHRWFRIFINGEDRGYSPLHLTDLSPGLLAIKGKTKDFEVSKLLEVKEGETIILNDSFFSTLSPVE